MHDKSLVTIHCHDINMNTTKTKLHYIMQKSYLKKKDNNE